MIWMIVLYDTLILDVVLAGALLINLVGECAMCHARELIYVSLFCHEKWSVSIDQ